MLNVTSNITTKNNAIQREIDATFVLLTRTINAEALIQSAKILATTITTTITSIITTTTTTTTTATTTTTSNILILFLSHILYMSLSL